MAKIIRNGAYVINLDEYADVGTHWIALYAKIMKLFISTDLVLNMFLKKSKNLLDIKTQKQAYSEYKQTIQKSVDTFVFDSLILCLQEEVRLILLVCFLLMISKKL